MPCRQQIVDDLRPIDARSARPRQLHAFQRRCEPWRGPRRVPGAGVVMRPAAFPPYRMNGTPGRIRTCDPRLRRPMLYPAELRAHTFGINELRNPCQHGQPVLRAESPAAPNCSIKNLVRALHDPILRYDRARFQFRPRGPPTRRGPAFAASCCASRCSGTGARSTPSTASPSTGWSTPWRRRFRSSVSGPDPDADRHLRAWRTPSVPGLDSSSTTSSRTDETGSRATTLGPPRPSPSAPRRRAPGGMAPSPSHSTTSTAARSSIRCAAWIRSTQTATASGLALVERPAATPSAYRNACRQPSRHGSSSWAPEAQSW